MKTKKLNQQKQSLQLVMGKVQRDQDHISERLKKTMDILYAEKEQMQQLKDYKEEYIKKIQTLQSGSATELQRYRSFCYQLDEALIHQEQKITLIESKRDETQELLKAHQHKVNHLSELLKNKKNEIVNCEDKALQASIDELSTRKFTQATTQRV